MKITTDSQHRALAFIDACNRSGYSPQKEDVLKWIKGSKPKSFGPADIFNNIVYDAISSTMLTKGEDVIDHLLRLGWIEGDNAKLNLSNLGQALLGAAERSDQLVTSGDVVVLGGEDPFAYARLIGHIARLGPVLLIDPYFRLDQLIQILNNTDITRVLTSKQHKGSSKDIAELKIALDSKSLPRPIELRASTNPVIHDRMIITKAGEVYTLGASLGSIGSSTTVLTPVPDEGAQTLQALAEKWWEEAQPILPDSASVKPMQADTTKK